MRQECKLTHHVDYLRKPIFLFKIIYYLKSPWKEKKNTKNLDFEPQDL